MPTIAVVFHSGYGHTKKVAEAIVRGASGVAGASVTLVNVDDSKGDYDFAALNAADGIVFGTPTYMGGYSAQFKTFIDAASKVWMAGGWKDKIAAGFTNSGSPSGDKQNTLTSLWVNAMQHGMVWAGTAMFPAMTEDPAGAGPDEINRLGGFSGLMTASAHKAGLEATPPPGDIRTAELFGKRVAEVTARWVAGGR